MTNFSFSPEDHIEIKKCIKKGHASWKDENIKSLKTRIKEHLKFRQKYFCCYCLRNISEEFNFVIDIEHILPKHKYVKLMFDMENLAASCKRCNMKMKGRRVDFITDQFNKSPNPFASENYKFIHPNSDVFIDHINYYSIQSGTNILVSYSVKNNSTKGAYSIEFFQLEKLARNKNDIAQGISVDDEDKFDGNIDDDDIDDNDINIGDGVIDIENAIHCLAFLNDQED